mgnify:CR=1 FL=1
MINHSSRKVSRTRFYFSLSRPYSYSKVLDLLVRNCVFLKIHILLFRNKHGKKERQRSSIYQSIGLHQCIRIQSIQIFRQFIMELLFSECETGECLHNHHHYLANLLIESTMSASFNPVPWNSNPQTSFVGKREIVFIGNKCSRIQSSNHLTLNQPGIRDPNKSYLTRRWASTVDSKSFINSPLFNRTAILQWGRPNSV